MTLTEREVYLVEWEHNLIVISFLNRSYSSMSNLTVDIRDVVYRRIGFPYPSKGT